MIEDNSVAFPHHEKLIQHTFFACLLGARPCEGCWRYSSEQVGETLMVLTEEGQEEREDYRDLICAVLS